MYLSIILEQLSDKILCMRNHSRDLPMPQVVEFLLQPKHLEAGVLYLTEFDTAQKILPLCSSAQGSIIFCAGRIDHSVVFSTSIHLICVDEEIKALYNRLSQLIVQSRTTYEIRAQKIQQQFSQIVEYKAFDKASADMLCKSFPYAFLEYYCAICIELPRHFDARSSHLQIQLELETIFPQDNIPAATT